MLKVAITLKVMIHYRINLLERLSSNKNFNTLVLHCNSLKNSKFKNYNKPVSFKHKELFSLQYVSKKNKNLIFSPTLIYHLIKFNPDVLLLEGEANMLNNVMIFVYSILLKKPFIWWGLGLVPGMNRTPYQKIYHPLKKIMIKKATYIIGYSSYSKEYYSQYVNSEKILVSFNCLDDEKIRKEIKNNIDSVEHVKKKYNLQNKKVLLFVGNLEKTKLLEKLFISFKNIKESFPSLALLIIGDGNYKKNLEDIVSGLKLEDIHFTGEIIENVSRYFLAADIFILPGRGGLAIHHALIHGLPVISGIADGTEKDMVIENYNGFLLKTNTSEELSEKIKYLINNNAVIKKYGLNSKKIVEERINIQNMTNVFSYAIENSKK